MVDYETKAVSPVNLDGYEDVLRMSEIAEIIRVDSKTVTRWCTQGKLAFFRTPGGHRRVRKEDFVKALIEAQIVKWSDEDPDEHERRTGLAGPGNSRTRSPEPEVATPRTRTARDRRPRRGDTEQFILVDPA